MIASKRVLLALCAVVVAAVVAAAIWLTADSSPHAPAVLQLVTTSSARGLAAPAESGTAVSGYVLTGPLPATPAAAPAYRLEGRYDTKALAAALPRPGLVLDHGAWSWPSCDATPDVGCAVAGGGVAVSGTVSAPAATSVPSPGSSGNGSTTSPPLPQPGTPSPQPTVPAMTVEQARVAAKPVLDAVGLEASTARVTVTPYGASVIVDPVVHGLATSGFRTQVELDRARQISYASGFVGDLARGDSYPLISARKAFDSLPVPPAVELLCPYRPGVPGCGTTPRRQAVTGAVLGLALRQLSSGPRVLVPAWLFTVKGWDEPLAQVAIPPAYLGTPAPRPGPRTTPITGEPGSVAPAPQVTGGPAPNKP